MYYIILGCNLCQDFITVNLGAALGDQKRIGVEIVGKIGHMYVLDHDSSIPVWLQFRDDNCIKTKSFNLPYKM